MRRTPPSPKSPNASAAQRASLAEWEQIKARFPTTSSWGLGFQIATTLSANGVIAWLVASERMTPFELVVLVVLEAAMLIAIAFGESRLVPAEARAPNRTPWRERLGMLVFALVWLGGAYGIVLLVMVPSAGELARLWNDPIAFLSGSNLKWPLLITLVGAVIDAVQDLAHQRRMRGQFISTPGLQGAARFLTLFLGGIPFFVPAVVVLLGIKTAVDKAAAWMRLTEQHARRHELLGALLVPLLGVPFMGSIAWLLESGVSGWAVGYCSAKFVSELLIVCLPLIASKAHAQESTNAMRATARH